MLPKGPFRPDGSGFRQTRAAYNSSVQQDDLQDARGTRFSGSFETLRRRCQNGATYEQNRGRAALARSSRLQLKESCPELALRPDCSPSELSKYF